MRWLLWCGNSVLLGRMLPAGYTSARFIFYMFRILCRTRQVGRSLTQHCERAGGTCLAPRSTGAPRSPLALEHPEPQLIDKMAHVTIYADPNSGHLGPLLPKHPSIALSASYLLLRRTLRRRLGGRSPAVLHRNVLEGGAALHTQSQADAVPGACGRNRCGRRDKGANDS